MAKATFIEVRALQWCFFNAGRFIQIGSGCRHNYLIQYYVP